MYNIGLDLVLICSQPHSHRHRLHLRYGNVCHVSCMVCDVPKRHFIIDFKQSWYFIDEHVCCPWGGERWIKIWKSNSVPKPIPYYVRFDVEQSDEGQSKSIGQKFGTAEKKQSKSWQLITGPFGLKWATASPSALFIFQFRSQWFIEPCVFANCRNRYRTHKSVPTT